MGFLLAADDYILNASTLIQFPNLFEDTTFSELKFRAQGLIGCGYDQNRVVFDAHRVAAL